eukprot:m.91657 g.91657  ORF g.91657 m.91657 type:complete len:1346 (-) comp26490_c0_seq2:90-4127(-)
MSGPPTRVFEGCVVITIKIEAPLPTFTVDGDAAADDNTAFDSVYRDYTILHTITGNTAQVRSNPSVLFTPNTARKPRAALDTDALPPALVSTLETFCFPDGAKVLQENPGNQDKTHSFVISESGFFVTCVTFYRETDAAPFWLAYECIRPRQATSQRSSSAYELHSRLSSVSESSGSTDLNLDTATSSRAETIFMPTCICFVSKLPYFGVMKNCLTSIVKTAENSEDLGDFLSEVMADLSRVPAPPSGKAAVRFRLRDRHCVSLPRFIVCKPPPLADLPIIDVPLRFIFQLLDPLQVLQIVVALLTEQRVIFVSNQYAKLTPTIEGILALIYPFKWQHVYIPVIPSHLRAFVEAPWPFLVGIHARYIEEILEQCQEDPTTIPLVVNLDSSSVTIPACVTLPKVPNTIVESFTRRCRALPLDYELYCYGNSTPDLDMDMHSREEHAEKLQTEIRAIFFELMVGLFGDIRRHMMFDMIPAVLNEKKYIASRSPESILFYKTVVLTSSFRLFQRSRHKHERDYFDLVAAREMELHSSADAFVFTLPDFAHKALERRRSADGTPLSATRDASALPTTEDDATPNYSKFREQAIARLNELLDRPQCPCVAQLLHLRGLFRVWHGDIMQGLTDFNEVMKTDAASFPSELVLDILRYQTEDLKTLVARKGPAWYDLVQKLKVDDKGQRKSRSISFSVGDPTAGVRLPEIGAESEVLQALKTEGTIDRKSFGAICDLLGITDNTTTARNLCTSLEQLCPEKTDDHISVAVFIQFIEIWSGLKDTEHSEIVTALAEGEEILKIVHHVRRSDTGTGTLVLTRDSLFMIPNNTSTKILVCNLNQIISMDTLQYKLFIPPGVPAIRLFTTDSSALLGSRKRSGVKPRRSTMKVDEECEEQLLLFFNERDAWHGYMMEMAMAHKAAMHTKDLSLISHAVENIVLAEAVLMITKETRSLDPNVADETVKRMLPYANPVKYMRLVSESSHKLFVKRIDSSPNQIRKATVECILFMPSTDHSRASGGTIWCGLGSGFIQILELPTGVCECRMKPHTNRVTCMLSIGDHVWSGSFDASILVIDTRTRRVIAVLEGIDDAVGNMFRDGDSVWVTTLGGKLSQYNCKTHERIKSIDVSSLRGKQSQIRTCVRIGDSLWCGTGSVIVIVDLKTEKLKRCRDEALEGDELRQLQQSELESRRLSLTDDLSDAQFQSIPVEVMPNIKEDSNLTLQESNEAAFVIRTSASHCMIPGINNEVWSCSNVTGLLQIWDAATCKPAKMGGEWRLDCEGFNVLLATETAIWGGGNNGSIYVWDPESHNVLQQLPSHNDGVRSLCEMRFGDERHIISGSGSNDGTLVIWKPPRR